MNERISFKLYEWKRNLRMVDMLDTFKYQAMVAREMEPTSIYWDAAKAVLSNAEKFHFSPPSDAAPEREPELGVLGEICFMLPLSFKREFYAYYESPALKLLGASVSIYMRDSAAHQYNSQLSRRALFIEDVSQLKERLTSSSPVSNRRLHSMNNRRHSRMVNEVLGFISNPLATLGVPVAKQWECLTAIRSIDNSLRISVVGKFANDSKRISKKSGSFFGWAFDAVNFDNRWSRKDREWFTSVATTIWTELLAVAEDVQMLYGVDLIEAYGDSPGVHSCMSRNPNDCLELYAQNPDKVRILVIKRDGVVRRRQLIMDCGFRLPDGTKLWALDREYSLSTTGAVKSIADILLPTGEGYKDEAIYSLPVENSADNTAQIIYGVLAYGSSSRMIRDAYVELPVPEGIEDIPYMDTWCNVEIYSSRERVLRLHHENGEEFDYKAQNGSSPHTTRWDYGDNNVWSEYHGRYIDREDAYYSNWLNDYVDPESDYISYAEDLDDYVPSDEAFYCECCEESYSTNTTSYECYITGNSVCENCIASISLIEVDNKSIENVEVQPDLERYSSYRADRYRIVAVDSDMFEFLEAEYSGSADYDLYARVKDLDRLTDEYNEWVEANEEEEEEELCLIS